MKRIIRNFLIVVLIISSSALGLRAQGVYSLTPQPVCWSYNGVDSSLLSLLVFDIRDTVGIFQGYVNAVSGSYVNTSAGGTVSAGYCCCGNTGTSQTVSITDNNDGTYTAIVGTDTTTIYTKADSLYTTQSIALGDTTYLANSVVQDILIALAGEVNNLRSETGCDLTITQASHGFAVGDLLTQDPNTGAYSAAAADTSINFPVAYVCSVVDANNFKVDTEGWVTGAHGGTVYRDYFLQDDASVDTTQGSFPIFAWRTFSATLRYFDIPEYVANGSSGGSSPDADWFEEGTTSPPNAITDNIFTQGNVGIGIDTPTQKLHLAGRLLFDDYYTHTISSYATTLASSLWDGSGAFQQVTQLNKDAANDYWLSIVAPSGGTTGGGLRIFNDGNFVFQNANGEILWKRNSGTTLTTSISQDANDILTIVGHQGISIDAGGLSGGALYILNNVPNYASDAAADADATLLSNGIYTVTAEDRTLRIKP